MISFVAFQTQIAVTHEKISKLEEAKEHWMLESQLLQVKYEKEAKVCWILNRFPAHCFVEGRGGGRRCDSRTSDHVQQEHFRARATQGDG